MLVGRAERFLRIDTDRGKIAILIGDDVAFPELARIIGLTQRSPISNAADRVDFLKLVWDAIGSEFGSRHTQYEMFYAGAPYVTCAHSYRTYDWGAADALVRKMLGNV